jgi:hypothetical protein
MDRQEATPYQPGPTDPSTGGDVDRRDWLRLSTLVGVSTVLAQLPGGTAEGAQARDGSQEEKTVTHLGSEQGKTFAEKALERSKGGQAIAKKLAEEGLVLMHDRTNVFSVYSPDSVKAIAIGIIPCVPKDQKDHKRAGGLSVSDGGFAKAVTVELGERSRLVSFSTYDVVGETVKTEKFEASQLEKMGAKALAERAGKVPAGTHLVELTVRQVSSITDLAQNYLLHDKFSLSKHSKEEIKALEANRKIVNEIGQFVLLRTSGSACCSCSCSCWGSSSCSCSSG